MFLFYQRGIKITSRIDQNLIHFAKLNKNQPKANVNAEEPVVVNEEKGKEE